jgi:rRNA maturation endonuclease Nob1
MVRGRDQAADIPCPGCRRRDHDEDAQFCKYCGANLGENAAQPEE